MDAPQEQPPPLPVASKGPGQSAPAPFRWRRQPVDSGFEWDVVEFVVLVAGLVALLLFGVFFAYAMSGRGQPSVLPPEKRSLVPADLPAEPAKPVAPQPPTLFIRPAVIVNSRGRITMSGTTSLPNDTRLALRVEYDDNDEVALETTLVVRAGRFHLDQHLPPRASHVEREGNDKREVFNVAISVVVDGERVRPGDYPSIDGDLAQETVDGASVLVWKKSVQRK